MFRIEFFSTFRMCLHVKFVRITIWNFSVAYSVSTLSLAELRLERNWNSWKLDIDRILVVYKFYRFTLDNRNATGYQSSGLQDSQAWPTNDVVTEIWMASELTQNQLKRILKNRLMKGVDPAE